MIPTPRFKICCIASVEEARLAVRYGASALGLVARMPSGPGPIADELIRTIAAKAPPGVATFLLSCETEPEAVVAHYQRCQTSVIQLVDAVPTAVYGALRKAAPALKIVQVIHVEDDEAFTEAQKVAPFVDGLLLDSGNTRLAVKELGGTGRTHDWRVSRRIVEGIDRPVFLAGGLSAANVPAAWKAVRPYGFDLCSGLRTDGALDESKVAAFRAAVDALPTA